MSTVVFNSKCIWTVYDNTALGNTKTIICDISGFDLKEPFFQVPDKTR